MDMNIDIDLLESLALAEDRTKALGLFTPGTREHFIATWLVAEQTGYPAELQRAIDEFCTNNGEHDNLVKAYRSRRKLVGADVSSPNSVQTAIDMIVQGLGLNLRHSRPGDAPPPVSSAPSAAGAGGEVLPDRMSAQALAALEPAALVDALSKRQEHFVNDLNPTTLPFERAEILAILRSRAAAWTGDGRPFFDMLHSLLNQQQALPSLDASEGGDEALADLILKAATSKYGTDHNRSDGLLNTVYERAPLAFLLLLGAKGRAAGVHEKPAYVAAVLRRLAPAAGTDFNAHPSALSDYLSAVSSYVATLPTTTFRCLRETVLYHKLKGLHEEQARMPDGAGIAPLFGPEGRATLEQLLALGPRSRQPYYDAPIIGGQPGRDRLNATNGWLGQRNDSSVRHCLAVPVPQEHEVDSLIRSCLIQLLAIGEGAPGTGLAPWSQYVSEPWLKGVQAEARLTRGSEEDVENSAAWARSLEGGPGALQALRDRVVLEFGSGNPEYLSPGTTTPVTLRLSVKGIPKVTASVYEISTSAYYRSHGREVPSDIPLDGLLPSVSYSWDFTGAAVVGPVPSGAGAAGGAAPAAAAAASSNLPGQPLRLRELAVRLPSLSAPGADRGVFVVEVVGGGRSSRAVLRKGSLRYLERRTVAGHLITVVGEDNVPLPADRVSVYLDGRRYTPEPTAAPASGSPVDQSALPSHEILIPYRSGGRSGTNLILTLQGEAPAGSPDAWSFSSLVPFTHYEESYDLACAWGLEREAVVRDNYSATVLLRPRLTLHGDIPAPLGALTDVSLTVAATDAQGSTSQRVERNLTLTADKELAVTFTVPSNVRHLSFTLQADVELCSGHVGSKQSLQATHSVSLNGIDQGDDTRDVHLRYTREAGYVLACLGKTGEPCPGVTLAVQFTSSLVQHGVARQLPSMQVRLTTGADGKVVLGHLPKHIIAVSVTGSWGSGGSQRSMELSLPQDNVAYPTTVHAVTSVAGVSYSIDGSAVRASSTGGVGGTVRAILGGLLGGGAASAGSNAAAGAGGGAGAGSASSSPTAAGDVIARFPFRPDADPATYALSRRDFEITEVRRRPEEGNTPAWVGAKGRNGLEGATVPVADAFAHARFDPAASMIVVSGLPAGFYTARVKRPYPGADGPGPSVDLRVLHVANAIATAGQMAAGSISLQARPGITTAAASAAASPLQIASITADHASGNLVIRVTGGAGSFGGVPVSKDVRVHLVATHFLPLWDVGNSLGRVGIPGLGMTVTSPPASSYYNGRTLGEEQRYVLERQEKARAGQVLPGNLLPRPQLLLNPFSLGKVGMDKQEAAAGDAYAHSAQGAGFGSAMGKMGMMAGGGGGGASHAVYVTYDFLPRPAAVLANLRVDPSTGLITVPLAQLVGLKPGAAGLADTLARIGEVFVTAVAVDMLCTYATSAAVPLSTARPPAYEPYRDLAVGKSALDPDSHVVQRSRIAVMGSPGAKVEVAAAAAWTKAEVYGSLDRAAGLLAALAGGAPAGMLVRDFSWLLQWPVLSGPTRAARYSKYGCHEVHTWLWWKDPAYFDSTLAPYLACKRAMTVVDHFLLGTSLAAKAVSGGLNAASAAACGQRAAAHWRALRAYATAPAFARLNAFEQALVAASLAPGDSAALARGLADVSELQPVDQETLQRVFKAALASNALSGQQDAEVEGLLAEADRAEESARQVRRQAAVPAPVPAAAPQPQANMLMSRGMPMARSMMAVPQAAPSAPMARSMAAPMAKSRAMAAPAMAMASFAPSAPMMAMAAPMAMMDTPEACVSALEETFEGLDEVYGRSTDNSDLALRATARAKAGYQPLDKTEEYAETAYHGVHRGDKGQESTVSLVPASPFWAGFAAHIAAAVATAYAEVGAVDAASDGGAVATAAAVARILRSRPFTSSHFALSAALPAHAHGSATFGCLTSCLLTLAVLGLPVERETDPSKATVKPTIGLNEDRSKLVYTAGATPSVLFYQDISPTVAPAASSSVLVGQAYVDPRDPTTMVKGQRVDKFLPVNAEDGSVEVVAGRVYECRVVISNISSATQQLSVLLHIPAGSLPCNNGLVLETRQITVPPYTTERLSYPFYLPRPGSARHFPVHVYTDGEGGEVELVAFAAPVTLRTVDRPTVRDATSWSYVAANGSEDEIVAFLSKAPLAQTASGGHPPCPLYILLWRMCGSVGLWRRVMTLLRERRVWHDETWALSFAHRDMQGMQEYLATEQAVQGLRNAGILGPIPCLTSPLLVLASEEGVDSSSAGPVAHQGMGTAYGSHYGGGSRTAGWEGWVYEHLEYSPLVNARAHQLGGKRKILNAAVARQWRRLLTALASKPLTGANAVSSSDRLAVAYLLLLQDRVDEAIAMFSKVQAPAGSIAAAVATGRPLADVLPAHRSGAVAGSPGTAVPSNPVTAATAVPHPWPAMQYDYCAAYLDFYRAGGGYGLPIAKAVAAAYADHPVPKWAGRFRELAQQLQEAGLAGADAGGASTRAAGAGGAGAGSPGAGADTPVGLEAGVSRELSREAGTSASLAREPSLELSTEGSTLVVLYSNLQGSSGAAATAAATLRLFAMDLEILFSTSPFTAADKAAAGGAGGGSGGGKAGGAGGMFSYVRPNHSAAVTLPVLPPGRQGEVRIPLPAAYERSNVMLELEVEGLRRTLPYYATRMAVAVTESFGRLRVTDGATGAPLPRVYVKVYATSSDSGAEASPSSTFFFKDCYTDARGVADYTSLSTDELGRARRFAILVSSVTHGALVRTALPPAGAK